MPHLESAEFQRALLEERLRLHAQVLPQSLLGGLVLALIVGGAWVVTAAAPLRLGLWLAMLLLALAAWLAAHLTRSRDHAADAASPKRLLPARLAFALHGVAWLAAALLVSRVPGAQAELDLVAFAIAVAVGAALIMVSFDSVAALCFVVPAALPLAAQLAQHPGAASPVGLAVAALFAMVVALAAMRGRRAVLTAAAARVAGADRSISGPPGRDRAAEVKLRTYEVVANSIDHLVSVVDERLVYRVVNDAWCRATAMSREQAVGAPVGRVPVPATEERLRALRECLERHEVRQVRGMARLPGLPEERFLETTYFPYAEAIAGMRCAVLVTRDITAEVVAQRSAQARDAEQRALLEAFPGFIAKIDAKLVYTFANDRLLALIGQPPEAVVGKSLDELLHVRDTEETRACCLRALAGETVTIERHYEERAFRPATDMHITLLARSDHAGGRAIYAFGTDVTALKRSEAALLAAKEEAERANRAKSQFVSQMSHELRTPLNAVLGFGQLLDAADAPPLPDPLRPHAREILRGARHLLDLINQVLDLGGIEAGRLQLRPETVDLRELGDECLSLVRPLALASQVSLPAPGALAAPAPVRADRTRLKQVLLNLLGNAIKYNRRGGEVWLSASPAGEGVRIAVRDSGPGLDDEQQRHLFEPFERLGADRTAVEGTGIGLAISRGLVHAMGGEIGVASVPGRGSTFWIELPRAGEDSDDIAAVVPSQLGPLDGLAPCHVLYIEDNAVNATLMQAMLEKLPGVAVTTVPDAAQGLEIAERLQPALVLTDIQLAGCVDGYELLQQLQANAATRDIPVVAVSANAMPADVQAGLAAGFADYLAKPFEMAVLHKTVLRLLSSPRGPS